MSNRTTHVLSVVILVLFTIDLFVNGKPTSLGEGVKEGEDNQTEAQNGTHKEL